MAGIPVSPRARRHPDRSGDPLDGLVNLFDVGIVLAVGFLLAALASVNLTGVLSRGADQPTKNAITLSPSDAARSVPAQVARTAGNGVPIGRVYRLNDGRLIYVVPKSALPGSGAPGSGAPASPSATPSPTATR